MACMPWIGFVIVFRICSVLYNLCMAVNDGSCLPYYQLPGYYWFMKCAPDWVQ